MARILLLYSSVDGHTRRICERIQTHLLAQGHESALACIAPPENGATADAAPPPLEAFDVVVIAASIRYGKHRQSVRDFIEAHLPVLASKPSAFCSVNLVARKPEKNQPHTNPYVGKFLAQTAWQPTLTDVFAGKLDYPRYRLLDKHIIRFIMWMTGGPTDLRTTVEYTDWQRVQDFAERIGRLSVDGG